MCEAYRPFPRDRRGYGCQTVHITLKQERGVLHRKKPQRNERDVLR